MKQKKESNDCSTCKKHIAETWNRWYLTFYDDNNNPTMKMYCEQCFDKELARKERAEAREKKKKINSSTLLAFI